MRMVMSLCKSNIIFVKSDNLRCMKPQVSMRFVPRRKFKEPMQTWFKEVDGTVCQLSEDRTMIIRYKEWKKRVKRPELTKEVETARKIVDLFNPVTPTEDGIEYLKRVKASVEKTIDGLMDDGSLRLQRGRVTLPQLSLDSLEMYLFQVEELLHCKCPDEFPAHPIDYPEQGPPSDTPPPPDQEPQFDDYCF